MLGREREGGNVCERHGTGLGGRSTGVRPPLSSENFWLLAMIALSFLFDKNYSIMNYLSLKDSSHDFSVNCIISFFFRLHLVLHACAAKFDVTVTIQKFLAFGWN